MIPVNITTIISGIRKAGIFPVSKNNACDDKYYHIELKWWKTSQCQQEHSGTDNLERTEDMRK